MASGDNLKLKGKLENFYLELIPILQRFPKVQRYTLAENIEKETLECARLIFEAEYGKTGRLEALKKLRTNLHLITFLLRVSHRKSFLKDNAYEMLTGATTEMGKLASSWIKREETGTPSGKAKPEHPKLPPSAPEQTALL